MKEALKLGFEEFVVPASQQKVVADVVGKKKKVIPIQQAQDLKRWVASHRKESQPEVTRGPQHEPSFG